MSSCCFIVANLMKFITGLRLSCPVNLPLNLAFVTTYLIIIRCLVLWAATDCPSHQGGRCPPVTTLEGSFKSLGSFLMCKFLHSHDQSAIEKYCKKRCSRLKLSYEIHLEGLSKFHPFISRVGSNPRRQSKNT